MARSARAETLSDGGLTQGYQALAGGFDELIDASGSRQAALGAAAATSSPRSSPATRSLRMEQLNARVRETGIAHDLFADPSSTAQPWRIDLVPLIVAPEEWRQLERALIQRAQAVRGHPGGPLRPAAAAGVGRHPA